MIAYSYPRLNIILYYPTHLSNKPPDNLPTPKFKPIAAYTNPRLNPVACPNPRLNPLVYPNPRLYPVSYPNPRLNPVACPNPRSNPVVSHTGCDSWKIYY